MLLTTVALQYCKSEYAPDRCEDAYAFDADTGIFAVSDGTGTSVFSRQWAKSLVAAYVEEPLLSDDRFEVEHWLRIAVMKFNKELSELTVTDADRSQLLSDGSAATFVGIRFHYDPSEASDHQTPSPSCQCKITTIGDSCCFHFRGTELLGVVPLQDCREFFNAPRCFRNRNLNGPWHRPQFFSFSIEENDTIVLATDKVALWLLENSLNLSGAIDTIRSQTQASWPGFVESLRQTDAICDDDSTALIIDVSDASGALPKTPAFYNAIRARRLAEFQQADISNALQLAAAYGDGSYLQCALTEEQRAAAEHSKPVAIAFHDVLNALRQLDNNRLERFESLQRMWDLHAPILADEICAQQLRDTLVELGIIPETKLDHQGGNA